MVVLKELSVDDGVEVYEMLQRIGPSENAFHNDANGMPYEKYKEWLEIQHAWSIGKKLPKGYVKQWSYWLLDEGQPVGYGKLREKATEESKRFGGNIGYAIDPDERNKGYGSMLFGLLLKMAALKGISEVFSTVEKYNYSSKKIHEKFGGHLIKEDEDRWYFVFTIADIVHHE